MEGLLCDPCPLRESCAYLSIFETPLPAGATKLRSLDRIPHPFVLRPWRDAPDALRRGDEVRIEIVLVGEAFRFLPHIVVAAGLMVTRGLGRARLAFSLEGIDQLGQRDGGPRRVIFDRHRQVDEPRPEALRLDGLHPMRGPLRLELLTPLHIVSEGQALQSLPFQPLARALLRRMSSLALFHCGADLALDFAGLAGRAASVRTVEEDLRFVTGSRFSRRQEKHIPLQGLLGSATFEGEALEEMLPLLALGEVLHVGKGTSLGMGRYRIGTVAAGKERRPRDPGSAQVRNGGCPTSGEKSEP